MKMVLPNRDAPGFTLLNTIKIDFCVTFRSFSATLHNLEMEEVGVVSWYN